MKARHILHSAVWIILWYTTLSSMVAQNLEHALWYELFYPLGNARPASIGLAFAGIADDGSSLIYNPAGLVLIPTDEITTQLFLTSHFADLQAPAQHTSLARGTLTLGSASYVYRRSPTLVFGAGVFARTQAQLSYELSGLNIGTSQLQQLKLYDDWGFILFDFPLLDDSLHILTIADSLFQQASITEEGILYDAVLGFAVDLNNIVALGATINVHTGSYEIFRSHTEIDTFDIYYSGARAGRSVSFAALEYQERITQTPLGVSIAFGIMIRPNPNFRIGVQLESSSAFALNNSITYTAKITKDNGMQSTYFDTTEQPYDQTTSYKLSVGASYHLPRPGLTLAAAFRFSDPSALSYAPSNRSEPLLPPELTRMQLTPLWTFGVGAEWDPPESWYALRSGITLTHSPYRSDSRLFPILHAGAAIYPLSNFRLEFFATFATIQLPHRPMFSLYTPFRLSSTQMNLGMQLTFRFP